MWGKNSANVTDASATSVHGTNPQNLIEKITRSKIYNHAYWKEHCFGLTAEALVDKAMELESIGGTFGGIREPTTFMQLMLKMLQIQPEKEIIVEFIKNEDYKYVRVLGAFYMRLVGRPVEVYQYLEPLYNDYRKIRRRLPEGNYTIVRVDELIDEFLRETCVTAGTRCLESRAASFSNPRRCSPFPAPGRRGLPHPRPHRPLRAPLSPALAAAAQVHL